MPRRIIDAGGAEWLVSISGRVTQYQKDEFGLVFARGAGKEREERVARYSPVGPKTRELSLAELTDDDLRRLLTRSQPAWTAPETGYAR
jgi:hypothetical protein